MKHKNAQDNLGIAYQGFLSQKLRAHEVREAKRELVRAYQGPGWFFLGMSPSLVFSLAASLLLVLGLSWFLVFRPAAVRNPATRLAFDLDRRLSAPVAASHQPGVRVQKITSQTGSVMVFQRPYHDQPITIIWVFKGGIAK